MNSRFKTRLPAVGLLVVVLLLLTACQAQAPPAQVQESAPGGPTQTPPASPLATEPPLPTATETPRPTDTPRPTETPIPSPEAIAGPTLPDLFLIPSGYAQGDEWNDIPLVPEVVQAQEAYQGYYYSTDLPVGSIKQFYEDKLAEAGWQLTGVGESEQGHIQLLFARDGQILGISLYDFSSTDWGGDSPIEIPQSFVLIAFK